MTLCHFDEFEDAVLSVELPETRLFLARCIDNSVGNTLQGLAFSFVLFSIPTYLGFAADQLFIGLTIPPHGVALGLKAKARS